MGAALASVSGNIMGGPGTLPFYGQAMVTTTSNFVYEGASIAQEHVERGAAVKELQVIHVGGMQSTESTVPGCLSPFLPVLQLT